MIVVAGLVMLGLLVVIHEGGHMIAAKLLGIGVPVFSVGMGPRIAGIRLWGTDFRLSAIPVGGYVRMTGADPFGDAEESGEVFERQNFMARPVWQRLIVMAAGPGANLLLPIVLFSAVLMGGEPQPDASVGFVTAESPAFVAGVREGDMVRRIGGNAVLSWGDVIDELLARPGQTTKIDLERDGVAMDVTVPGSAIVTVDGLLDGDALGIASERLSSSIGVDDPSSPAFRSGLRTADRVVSVDGVEVRDWRGLIRAIGPGAHAVVVDRVAGAAIERIEVKLLADAWASARPDPWANGWGIVPLQMFVRHVVPEGAAVAAGILPNDRLWSVDGSILPDWRGLTQRIMATVDEQAEAGAPRPVRVEVVREGAIVGVQLVPTLVRELVRVEARYRPMIGVQRWDGAFVTAPEVRRYYGPWEAVVRSVQTSRRVLSDTLQLFGNLSIGNVKVDEGLGGPVEIFRHAAASAEEGIFAFARMMGMISFSLGIVNLLPVPVLDGGHILFYTLEAIRGRPLSLVVRERLQMAGVLALVALMLYVTWGEVLDVVFG